MCIVLDINHFSLILSDPRAILYCRCVLNSFFIIVEQSRLISISDQILNVIFQVLNAISNLNPTISSYPNKHLHVLLKGINNRVIF